MAPRLGAIDRLEHGASLAHLPLQPLQRGERRRQRVTAESQRMLLPAEPHPLHRR